MTESTEQFAVVPGVLPGAKKPHTSKHSTVEDHPDLQKSTLEGVMTVLKFGGKCQSRNRKIAI